MSTFSYQYFNFAAILYQEYSDVAINREIQRQQGKEPGTEEEGLRDEGSDGTPSPSNLSPSSSFRSSRGSAFALWQDIPDVRTSGQLDNFSNEERKLQEVMEILEFSRFSIWWLKLFIKLKHCVFPNSGKVWAGDFWGFVHSQSDNRGGSLHVIAGACWVSWGSG